MPLPTWWSTRCSSLALPPADQARIESFGCDVTAEMNGLMDDQVAAQILSVFADQPWRLEADYHGELVHFLAAYMPLDETEIADLEDTEQTRRVNALSTRLHTGIEVCAIPPPTPIVEGLLFTPGQSVVYAPPKAGKTFFALALALSIATGHPFMGYQVTRSPVLYVAAEGVGGLGRRVAAWCTHHDRHDIGDAHFLTTAINLSVPQAVDTLAAMAQKLGVRHLVLDTLARCTVGVEENSAKEMGGVVEALDRLRDAIGHVQVVHHAGKDTTRGMRGSTALLGAVDTTLELSGDTKALKVTVAAQKDAEPLEPWWCRLNPVDASAVITTVSDQEMVSVSHRLVLDALIALPVEDRTATKWKTMAEEMGVAERSFWRSKKWLQETRRVVGGGGQGKAYQLGNTDELVEIEDF